MNDALSDLDVEQVLVQTRALADQLGASVADLVALVESLYLRDDDGRPV